MSMCLLSAYITGFFASVEGIDYQESAAFTAPVTEEVMKLLPLLFLFFVFEESGQNIYLASVALGIGFATFENCVYILGNSSESFSYMLIRGLAAGVMHLVCAVALGLGLILEKRHPKLAFSGILGILSLFDLPRDLQPPRLQRRRRRSHRLCTSVPHRDNAAAAVQKTEKLDMMTKEDGVNMSPPAPVKNIVFSQSLHTSNTDSRYIIHIILFS